MFLGGKYGVIIPNYNTSQSAPRIIPLVQDLLSEEGLEMCPSLCSSNNSLGVFGHHTKIKNPMVMLATQPSHSPDLIEIKRTRDLLHVLYTTAHKVYLHDETSGGLSFESSTKHHHDFDSNSSSTDSSADDDSKDEPAYQLLLDLAVPVKAKQVERTSTASLPASKSNKKKNVSDLDIKVNLLPPVFKLLVNKENSVVYKTQLDDQANLLCVKIEPHKNGDKHTLTSIRAALVEAVQKQGQSGKKAYIDIDGTLLIGECSAMFYKWGPTKNLTQLNSTEEFWDWFEEKIKSQKPISLGFAYKHPNDQSM